jgi:phosphatidylinositol-3-phosphatase
MLRVTPILIALLAAIVLGSREVIEGVAGSGPRPVRATASTMASPSPTAAQASARASLVAEPAVTPSPATATPSPTADGRRVAVNAAIPAFSHIYLIVMENHEYSSIVGSSHAPYLNSLIRRYGLATNDHAVTHPSEPNYLALFAGSTFGVRDDGIHNLAARNLADQLEAKGRTWHVYAQDLPSRCYAGASARGGVDLVGAAGWYARKHEPAISFTDIARNATRCGRITHLAGFSATAASFELIVPNMTNDMHDGTIAQGDSFLRSFVPRITSSSAFATSLLLITWDEGSTNLGGGGHVATLVVSPRVPAGFRSSVSHTHYSLLRTVEDAWGLGCLNQTCAANDLREFFGR